MSLVGALLRRAVPLLAASPPCTVAKPRSYMKNFEVRSSQLTLCTESSVQEPNDGIRPKMAWQNQNRLHFQSGRKVYVNRIYLPALSEVQQRRKTGYEARMCTEGGRRILLRKMLRGKDVLGGYH
jgi:ribosomal protein L34